MKNSLLLILVIISFTGTARAQVLAGNDLSIIQTKAYIGTSGLHLCYSQIPSGQADSIRLLSSYHNSGSQPQPDCIAQFSLFKSGTLSNSSISASLFLLAPDSDASSATVFNLTANNQGNYIATVNIRSDSLDYFPTDNADTIRFSVSDSTFSINNSTKPTGSYYLLRNDYGIANSIGGLFEVTRDDTVTSITTAVYGGVYGTHPAAVIQASVYPVTYNGDTFTCGAPIVSTYPHTIVATDITDTSANVIVPITLNIENFSGNPILSPGLYWAAIRSISAPDSNVLVATTTSIHGSMTLVDSLSEGTGIKPLNDTMAPYCLMNFGHPKSIFAVDFSGPPSKNISFCLYGSSRFGALTNASNNAAFDWEINGLHSGEHHTSYARNIGYAFQNEDTFEVCLTVIDGSDTGTICKTYYTHICADGISTLDDDHVIKLYPNPANTTMNISTLGEAIERIRVEDIAGKIVADQYDGRIDIDISSYSSGIYFVEVYTKTGKVVLKFLKE